MIDGRGISRNTDGRESSICAVQIEQVGRVGLRCPCARMSQAQATVDEAKLFGCQENLKRNGEAIDGLGPSDNIML